MTFPLLFAGRRTLRQLQDRVEQNIARNHRRSTRRESTKTTAPKEPHSTSSQNASSSSSATASSSSASSSSSSSSSSGNASPPPPPPRLQSRTIPGPAWAWIDPLLTPFRAYGRMQARSPLTTQFESTLVIYYLGDLSAQTMQTNGFTDSQYEPLRGLRAMLIGAGSSIPGYRWFLFLGRNFNYSSHLLSLGVKVVVNQCVFTPVFNCYFFGMQTLLAGGSLQDARERIVRTVPVSWKNSWKLWPAVTAFSFTFVPWQYRNVFAGVIAIGWQTYLSWLNRREEHREEKEKVLVLEGQADVGSLPLQQPLQLQQPGDESRRSKRKKKVKKKEDGDEVIDGDTGGLENQSRGRKSKKDKQQQSVS